MWKTPHSEGELARTPPPGASIAVGGLLSPHPKRSIRLRLVGLGSFCLTCSRRTGTALLGSDVIELRLVRSELPCQRFSRFLLADPWP